MNTTDHIVERHFPGARLIATERLTGGVSADVYRLDLLLADGSKSQVVLRSHGPNHCGHSVELEFQLLKALSDAGLPVPKPLCVDASCDVLEHPFLMIAFVEGSSAIDHSKARPYIDKMVKELFVVHQTATDTLPDLPRRIDPLPELLDFLPAGSQWLDFRTCLKTLQNTAFEGVPVLLHGDYWSENLIWSDGRIAAILDWEDAALGDPLSDVACACLELRYTHGEEGMRLFQDAYAQHGTVKQDRLALWLAYVASAALQAMDAWGLEPSRERRMRITAHKTLREAASFLL